MVTNVKTGVRGALASLLARAPRQSALRSSAASGLQLLTQSHSPPAYLPKARTGPSLQSYRSSTPACKRHTSAPSLGPKTSPSLHTEVLDYITCPRPDGGLKAQGSKAQHKPSLCLMPSPPKHSPYMPSFPRKSPHDLASALEFKFYAVFEREHIPITADAPETTQIKPLSE